MNQISPAPQRPRPFLLDFRYPGPLLMAAILALGCGPASGGGKSTTGGKCFVPSESAPENGKALSAIEFPKSQVWVQANVPESAVSQALAREIPFTLASENKRDVGAPGHATYRVTRGTPSIHAKKDGLEVRVPIEADISVCKKIGSSCIQYGSCKPAFLAKFSLNPEVGDNFQMAAPEGTISATKRCVIGLDVTSQIEEIAKKEVAKVEAQIKREWPRFQPEVEVAWRELDLALPIADGHCAHLYPNKIFYQKAHLNGKDESTTFETAVGLSGTVKPAPSCSEERDALPLPAPITKEKPATRSRLWIPEVLSLSAVREDLKRSLTSAAGAQEAVEVLDVRVEPDRVLLNLKTEGSVCGVFWLEGKLSAQAGGEALTLKDVKLLSGERPAEMEAILNHVAHSGKVTLKSASWFTEANTQPLEAALRAAVPAQVKFDIKNLKADDARVVAADDGVYVLHPLTFRLVVTGF